MTTPVKPIETFGASSQRSLEEFRLDYNTALVSQPKVWAETYGDVIAGSSLKDTLPVVFSVMKFREKNTQAAPAYTALVKDISVIKREFLAAAEAELRRIQRGDFAYVRDWARKPDQMARARVFLRNHTVATLIETGETSATCVLDGLAFFSASHKVNPFDDSITFHGSATWSNFQASATPLTPANLTAEKALFKQTPGPDGEELGLEADIILVPTSLDDTAYNMLSVQDLILSGALSGGGDGTMGGIRNPHLNSGMTKVRSPELAGTDGTADWYLLSSTALAMGLYPWVISEDAADEIRTWDETSDYYKNTGNIKIQSNALLEAAFAFPHGIRKISGS